MQTFNEWMAFRQTVPETAGYRFIGTFNTDKLGGLKGSKTVSIEEALTKIPESYRSQFGGAQKLEAGVALGNRDSEVVWITNQDMELTYIFERQ